MVCGATGELWSGGSIGRPLACGGAGWCVWVGGGGFTWNVELVWGGGGWCVAMPPGVGSGGLVVWQGCGGW